jgi:aspartate-semialdehyde dehydrogenase
VSEFQKKAAYNVAIAGATGAVGETFLDLLAERDFPIANLKLLASKRSVGKEITYKGKTYKVEELTHDCWDDVDIAFFSAGGGRSLEYAPSAAKAGALVVDNSSAFRMDPNVPLVVPEVNPEDAFKHKGIIANPNCTTIIMLVALKPLYDFSKIKNVIVSSYQSTSGAGAQAMEELENQAKQWVKGEELTVDKFAHQILFNVIPHVDSFTENGYTKEEMKMFNETQKMLHDTDIKVSATCVRVPTLSAHSEAITIETEDEITVEKARELFAAAPGLEVEDDIDNLKYPMPLFVAGGDTCYVGRIRKDIARDNCLTFWVVGDQLRKGAATNAIQIAELFIK